MTLALRLTHENIKDEYFKTIEKSANMLINKDILASATYVSNVPSLTGDFTGESYKLLRDITSNKFVGAYLSGVPTAQQLIGRARWLMRVAVATVGGFGSHLKAETEPPIRVKEASKELGAVEYVFGSANKKWGGVLRVSVEPVKERVYMFENKIDNLCKAVKKAREFLADERFFADNAWRLGGKHENRYAPVVSNRFNSLLAMGSYLCEGKSMFIPTYKDESTRERLFRFIDPVKSDLVGFRLRVMLDRGRYNPKNKIEWKAIRLGVASLLATPILLGIGKAVNRGFGHYIIKKGSLRHCVLGDNVNEYSFNDIKRLLNLLLDETKKLLGVNNIKGLTPSSIHESSIPRLPSPDTEFFNNELKVEDDFHALNRIGLAALKAQWKFMCRERMKAMGKYYHTWPLGLPRGIKKYDRKRKRYIIRGYFLKNGADVRRQSFISAFSLDGERVYVLGYPSGDLVRVLPGILYHYGKYSEDSVSDLLSKVKVLPCNTVEENFSDIMRNPERSVEFLYVIFNNYYKVLEKR